MPRIVYNSSKESSFTQESAVRTDFLADRLSLHNNTGLLDLSGGTGGQSGQTVYTANGVVVTSSAPVPYSGSYYYYMGYLFNNTIPTVDDAAKYWLLSTTGNQTLTFDFGANPNLTGVNVYPRARNDVSSNYRILVSDDNITYTELVPWVINTHDSNTPYGTLRQHIVSIKSRYVKFELTQNGAWGIALSEIQFLTPNTGYPTDKDFYVTTTNNNQINTSRISGVSQISVSQDEPAHTSIKYLVSLDNRVSWKSFDGVNWGTVSLSDIAVSGMTKSLLESITEDQWNEIFVKGTLDFAVSLKTTDNNVSPSLAHIVCTFTMEGAKGVPSVAGSAGAVQLGTFYPVNVLGEPYYSGKFFMTQMGYKNDSLVERNGTMAAYQQGNTVSSHVIGQPANGSMIQSGYKNDTLKDRNGTVAASQQGNAYSVHLIGQPYYADGKAVNKWAGSVMDKGISGSIGVYQHGNYYPVYFLTGQPLITTWVGVEYGVGTDRQVVVPRNTPLGWHPLDLYEDKKDRRIIKPYKDIAKHWSKYPQT